VAAWRSWLAALGSDAEAALAASMAYAQLEAPGREQWLAALEHDLGAVEVAPVAAYAPLLAVERDPERRSRMLQAMGNRVHRTATWSEARALHGISRDGRRVAAIVRPSYLDFVEVLAFGYHPREGIDWVRHDPIVGAPSAPALGQELNGIALQSTSVGAVVDELAHAVVAHTRSARPIPDALRAFADLFGNVGRVPVSDGD